MARILIDLDDVLCHHTRAITKYVIANPTNNLYPQSQFDFYRKLKPIRGAVQAFRTLAALEEHSVWIVSAPSVFNPMSYTEKRMWVEDHLGIEHVHRLILCSDKSLIKGDILIDDHTSGRGQENFEGTLIKFDPENHSMWQEVLSMIPHKDNFPFDSMTVRKAETYTSRIFTDVNWGDVTFYCHSPLITCRDDRNYYLIKGIKKGNEQQWILETPKSWVVSAIEKKLRSHWTVIAAGKQEGWSLISSDYNRKVKVTDEFNGATETSALVLVDRFIPAGNTSASLLRVRSIRRKGSKIQKLLEAFPRTLIKGTNP